jgi:8-oxo-dGTP pyrophosphatase MutT (NUDIX family)
VAQEPDLESVLRDRLARPLPGAEAQLKFAPHPRRKSWRPDQDPEGARQAAALILLYPGAGGPSFPLTVRRHDLPVHAGQISLPGGRVDPGESPALAALRETHEELGIDPASVRLVGALSPLWVIVSNFVVRPFIGMTDTRPEFRPAPHEVSALLEAPIAAIHDTNRIHWTARVRDGLLVHYPYFEFQGHHVWGATAMMLSEFASLLDPSFNPPPRPADTETQTEAAGPQNPER